MNVEQSSVQVTTFGAECVVMAVHGAIDDPTVATCTALLDAAVDTGARLVIVDLEGAGAAVELLLDSLTSIRRQVRERSGTLLIEGDRAELRSLEPGLAEVFDAYRHSMAEHDPPAAAG